MATKVFIILLISATSTVVQGSYLTCDTVGPGYNGHNPGDKCHFPFYYFPSDRDSCITSGNGGVYWCFTVPNAAPGSPWADCDMDSCRYDCPAGMFNFGADCVECEQNFYKSTVGPEACISCPSGTEGTGATECAPVVPGKMHVWNKGNLGYTECAPVVPGKMCGTKGSGSPILPVCPAGNFLNATNDDNCEQCPQGSFSISIDSTGCTACTTGTTTDGPGSNSSTECNVCEVGYYGTTCSACESNTYKSDIGPDDCTTCPNSKITSETASTSQSDCYCPTGSFLNCANGNNCEPCPQGYYSDLTDSTSCTMCPFGKTTPGEGSSAERECTESCYNKHCMEQRTLHFCIFSLSQEKNSVLQDLVFRSNVTDICSTQSTDRQWGAEVRVEEGMSWVGGGHFPTENVFKSEFSAISSQLKQQKPQKNPIQLLRDSSAKCVSLNA